jgi:hypothetical protein
MRLNLSINRKKKSARMLLPAYDTMMAWRLKTGDTLPFQNILKDKEVFLPN